MDRTPFHKEYVLAKLDKKKKDGIRLLKAFLRGAGVYGAEEKFQGFSGYLCELLILAYGSFEALLRAAAGWSKTEIIDIEGIHKEKENLVRSFGPGLIVIDPVDRNRNVASAVSEKSLATFIEYCRNFLKKPSEAFFIPQEIKTMNQAEITRLIAKRGTCMLVIKFAKPDIIEEILYSQLRKSLALIRKQLEGNDFRIYDSDFFEDGKNCYFVLETLESELPGVRIHMGPPVYERLDSERFLDKHSGGRTWLVGDRRVAEVGRKCTRPEQCIKKMIKEPEKYGIGSHILEPIKKAKLLSGRSIKGMPVEFTRYLVKK